MSRTVKKALLPVGIILIAVAVAAAIVLTKKEPEKQAPKNTAPLVDVVKLERRDIRLSVSSQGNIAPRTETTLISEISGVVLEVSAKFVAGGFFKRGEVLLRLDPTDYEVALQQARANLLGMQAKFTQETARAEQAVQEWALSGRKKSEAPILALRTPYLEEAKANVLFAEANLKKAERKLEQTRIRAPYDGMVKDKLVDVGQYVSTGTKLAHTFAVDFAEVRLPLTDQDVAYLQLPGPAVSEQAAEAGPAVDLRSVIGGQPYEWNAYIVRSEGVIDPRTRVHFVVARIRDPYGLHGNGSRPPLSIGSFVEARIAGITAADVIAIPRQALRGLNQVLLMDSDNRLHIRDIDVFFSDEDYVYIKGGVSLDEYAVISALEEPVEGMTLRTLQEEPS